MDEELATAETVKELAKASGLRRYIWIYFLLVPLAASTASAVAIIIAALQGLSTHELASRIYAMTLLLGFKAIAIIACAYLVGLLFAIATAWLIRTRAEHVERRTRDLRKENVLELETLEMERLHFAERQNRLASILLPGAVLYSAAILFIGASFYLWQDIMQVWELVSHVAYPEIVDQMSPTPSAASSETDK